MYPSYCTVDCSYYPVWFRPCPLTLWEIISLRRHIFSESYVYWGSVEKGKQNKVSNVRKLLNMLEFTKIFHYFQIHTLRLSNELLSFLIRST
jgi:hypothetical protein